MQAKKWLAGHMEVLLQMMKGMSQSMTKAGAINKEWVEICIGNLKI
jgi:hypothetical protein